MTSSERLVRFNLGGIEFEYDEEKNRKNIEKHGISFRNAARVFFDYDRIEMYDEEHSDNEDRYDTIGDTSAGNLIIIGNLHNSGKIVNDILFVVYTERALKGGVFMVNITEMNSETRRDLQFTAEELNELERARNMPITFDEDCPETTPERALKFKRVNPVRKTAN